ncbi:MerR family transcriptional regulator [Streptomyces daghestanicus]|uniref:MerR family transcriptional regulator n=1 Tax=Streptomyces daghestanicus TaxID=66885 RepID=A0ABQ3QBB4_9ACTN|nr:MerR family transcriptional regulator [Streptomyces daghestanicus]GGU44430.1 MerR family transcriptional regulator [Streptomyces daghestanicus]GHI34520.1 MerR family transcriptional regulator [Streptomyces daghestanicus]
MTVTHDTWAIGELAAATGLPVKTVRYYSDSGLLPEAGRSAGGHRRYGADALERLRLIRRLRALDLPVATIARVVNGELPLADLVTGELDAVQARLTRLRWQQATLRALDDCSDTERLRRLAVLARVQRLPDAHLDLVRTWERMLPATLPAGLAAAVVGQAVPDPPRDPTAETALAYAELHALAAHPAFPEYYAAAHARDRTSLYAGLLDACELSRAALDEGLAPGPGPALDAFARACARGRGEPDGPGFRGALADALRWTVPLFGRYWGHYATVTGAGRPTEGTAHVWCVRALRATAVSGGPVRVRDRRPPAPRTPPGGWRGAGP